MILGHRWPLYHYTCSHYVERIDNTGYVVPATMLAPPHVPLPWPSELAWFTDLARPNRDALGLTSHALSCDRTEHRYRVTDATTVVPYVRYARDNLTQEQRDALEAAPGARPMHWYVATGPVPVDYA